MHVTRPPGMPALQIVMPRPQLPRSCSSVQSSVSSPRTPRTPSCTGTSLFASSTNRNSTDSWNSSNAADDLEWDWKPEQLRLLSRTLDALPAHLVTPFNGPIPPSNLLDKIARGVSQAKGPVDWPHSLRATRVKLIELSRARAKEEQGLVYSDIDADESNDLPSYNRYPDSAGQGIKRPLYRQSSMDFMNSADLRNSEGIDCLSDRLQRPDRLIPKTPFHPYSRHSRSRLSSPACSVSLITPSTPSSSTLNTLASFSSAKRALRRNSSNLSSTSASSMSIVSSNGGAALPDPRVQRVRHSESYYAPPPPLKEIKLPPSPHKENLKDTSPAAGVKRAPSFSATAQEARRDRQVFGGALNVTGKEGKDLSTYPSSDEEEKIRSKGAKKMRVKDFGGLVPAVSLSTGTPPSSSLTKKTKKTPCEDCKSPKSPTPSKSKRSQSPKPPVEATAKPTAATEARKHPRATPMNVQRNPSIFGAELPHLRSPPASSPQSLFSPLSPSRLQPSPCLPEPSPASPGSPVPATPHEPKVKTLRRVQRLTLGRRISFGSLVAPGDDADGEEDFEDTRGLRRQRELGQLGSAFQLL